MSALKYQHPREAFKRIAREAFTATSAESGEVAHVSLLSHNHRLLKLQQSLMPTPLQGQRSSVNYHQCPAKSHRRDRS